MIFVEVEEIELEEIKGEHIHHGLLGRFLKYGAIDFDCRFIGDVSLLAIRKPYRFIKALHVARSRVVDSMAYAISSVQGGGREVGGFPKSGRNRKKTGRLEKSMSCTIVWNGLSPEEWDRRFAVLPRSTFLQSYDYARAVCALQKQKARFGLIQINGKEAGLVQILETGILWDALHTVILDRGLCGLKALAAQRISGCF